METGVKDNVQMCVWRWTGWLEDKFQDTLAETFSITFLPVSAGSEEASIVLQSSFKLLSGQLF